MDDVIDFDQLQNEINEAEKYLREEVLRTKTQGYGRTLRASREKKNVPTDEKKNVVNEKIIDERKVEATPTTAVPTTPTSKYSNPESREKLLNRLISEHGSRHSTLSATRNTTGHHSSSGRGHSGKGNQDMSDLASRSSVYSSKSSTPYHDTYSTDTPVSQYDAGGGDNYFFKTIKKYSGGNSSDPQYDETLFFASDMISPSQQKAKVEEYSESIEKRSPVVYSPERDVDHLVSQHSHTSSPHQEHSPRGHSLSPKRQNRVSSVGRRPNSASSARKPVTSAASDTTAGFSQKKILKNKDQIIAEAEDNFKRQHTFKPNVESSKLRKNADSNRHDSCSIERINAMIQVHDQSLANRERQKIELERSNVEQNCSFKPQLSVGTKQIMRRKAKETGTKRFHEDIVSKEAAASQRLYQHAHRNQVQKRMLKHQLDESRNAECTFQPSLNPNSLSMVGDHVEQRPLYERVGDVQRQQAMSRQVLLECYEEAEKEKLTHNPNINDKSRKIVDKSRQGNAPEISDVENSNDVGSRLMNEARNQLNRKYRLIEEREKELANQVKTPELCKGSQKYVSNNPKISKLSFIQRQEDHTEKVKGHISESRKREESEFNQWFKPGIATNTNHILSETRPEVIEETPEQRAQRLYRDDVEDIEKKRRQIEEEMYGNISFVPEIDPISKALVPRTGIKELSENKRGQRLKMKAKQHVEQRESEECTFHPQISKSQKSYIKELYSSGKANNGPNLFAPHMAWEDVGCLVNQDNSSLSNCAPKPVGSINMREPERMAKEIRSHQLEKDEKRRAALIVREIDELQECTFQPKIYRKPLKKQNSNPVTVAGVGRHFELKYLKHKKDEEIRQRKEDAFRVKNIEKYKRKEDGSTIVEPFRFSETMQRKSRAAEELEVSEISNLTFHPVTKDLERRIAAKQVMQRT